MREEKKWLTASTWGDMSWSEEGSNMAAESLVGAWRWPTGVLTGAKAEMVEGAESTSASDRFFILKSDGE